MLSRMCKVKAADALVDTAEKLAESKLKRNKRRTSKKGWCL